MTRTEAIAILDSGEFMNRIAVYDMETVYGALDIAVGAIREQIARDPGEQTKYKPLPLAELKAVTPGGDRLWVEIIGENVYPMEVQQVDCDNGEAMEFCYLGVHFRLKYKRYGETWRAYWLEPKETDDGGEGCPQVGSVRHGRWLAYCDFWRKCSECGETWHEQWVIRKALRYCPNCGARMDGEADGHE